MLDLDIIAAIVVGVTITLFRWYTSPRKIAVDEDTNLPQDDDEDNSSSGYTPKPLCTLQTYEHASITDAELSKLYRSPKFKAWLIDDQKRFQQKVDAKTLRRRLVGVVLLALTVAAVCWLPFVAAPIPQAVVEQAKGIAQRTQEVVAVLEPDAVMPQCITQLLTTFYTIVSVENESEAAWTYESQLRQGLAEAPQTLLSFLKDPTELMWQTVSDVSASQTSSGVLSLLVPPEAHVQWFRALIAFGGLVLLLVSEATLLLPATFAAGEQQLPASELLPVWDVLTDREERAQLAAVVGFVLMCGATGAVGFGWGFLVIAGCVSARVFWVPSLR